MSRTLAEGPHTVARLGCHLALAALVLATVGACGSLRVGIGGSQAEPSSGRFGPRGEVSSSLMPTSPAVDTDPPPAGSGSAMDTAAPASFAPRIGYISLDDDLAYVNAVSRGIEDAVESAGLELVACDPDWTREGVVECAERLGDLGIDGLLSFQPFGDLAERVCELTGRVPTAGVIFDQGSCQVTVLHVDQAEAGRLAGEHVGRVARQRWDCEISAFVSLASSTADLEGQARLSGYRAGYEEQCPLPTRSPVIDRADRLITAETAMAGLLDGLRGRRIIVVGINEDAILGAMKAASDAGRADDLWYSGQLTDPAIRVHIACDPHYLASVAQWPERFGGQLVPSLVSAIAGQAVPTEVEAPLQLVTADNVRQLFPDTPPCDG